jgi:hypothetical protein
MMAAKTKPAMILDYISVLLKYLLSRKTVQSAVLLVGLCDSGKTLLFSRVSISLQHMSMSNPTIYRRQKLYDTDWMDGRCLQLLSGKFKKTQTSITDSSAPYKAKNERVRRKRAVVRRVSWKVQEWI